LRFKSLHCSENCLFAVHSFALQARELVQVELILLHALFPVDWLG